MEHQEDGTAQKCIVECVNQRCVYFSTRFSYASPTVDLVKE
jgi:hypothetical protein